MTTEETRNTSSWDWTSGYKKWESLRVEEEEIRKDARVCTGCRNLDRSDERRVFELATEEKIKLCQIFRGRGDAFVREGQFFRASLWYRKALSYYEYTFPEHENEAKVLDEIRFTVLIALARCDLRHKLYRQVLNHCYQALQIQANEKTTPLLIRAEAYLHLDDYDAAALDLNAIVSPSAHKDILSAQLSAKQSSYRYRSKAQSKRIIEGLAPENVETKITPNQTTHPSSLSEKLRYRQLLRDTHTIVPRPISARNRDALDDLYTPLETTAFILDAIHELSSADGHR